MLAVQTLVWLSQCGYVELDNEKNCYHMSYVSNVHSFAKKHIIVRIQATKY